jgi:hypothetical protein
MKSIIKGHRYGELAVPEELLSEIADAIQGTKLKPGPGMTKAIKRSVLDTLQVRGWSDEVMLDPNSNITITSVKEQVGLCLQTGNVSRMYADLLKLQALYMRFSIKAGVLIVPTMESARCMGKNLTTHERLISELMIFERIISAPIVAIGIE